MAGGLQLERWLGSGIAANLDRSTVRTSDFKSENRGSIPRLGVFVFYATINTYIINMFRRKTLSAFALASAFLLPASFLNQSPPQGQAWTWGFGRNGELGLGSQSNSSLPQSVKNRVFVDIDAKKSFSAGITSEGKLFTWGKNRNGMLGHLPPNLNLLISREVEFP